jgi:NAD(P)-dependent dehydrogenase (short-subunit alcohol dehydrogenase family)
LVAPQPVPRLATLEEVADVAIWLASPLTDYVTGQVLAIDGGLTLASALGGAFAAAAGPALQAAARRP